MIYPAGTGHNKLRPPCDRSLWPLKNGTPRRIGVLVAFATGRGIANRTAGALGCSATCPYSAFHASLRFDAGLCSRRARLRSIDLLVAAARRPALHIAPALHAATDLGVG